MAEIQRLIPEAFWRHHPRSSNPADCASRGLLPSELIGHKLWHGPPFLRDGKSTTPNTPTMTPEKCQQEQCVLTMTTSVDAKPEENEILQRFSNLHRLFRVTAWCRRWLPGGSRREIEKTTGMTAIRCHWVRYVQETHYKKELSLISAKSRLLKKSPFSYSNPGLRGDPESGRQN